MTEWYPQNKKELSVVLEKYLSKQPKIKSSNIHGVIVPHAGYMFSGEIAGKIFSLLSEKKISKVIILGPSHYVGFYGVKTLDNIETPLGKIKIIENNFQKLRNEHSIENQIPFLQKINPSIKILPLVVGEISEKDAEEVAKKISKDKNTLYVFSTDLSHFLPYENAVKTDKETIKIIENLDFKNMQRIDACGKFPLMILMKLCKLKNWKPKLVEYKNSGDITGDKSSVVGYAGFIF